MRLLKGIFLVFKDLYKNTFSQHQKTISS